MLNLEIEGARELCEEIGCVPGSIENFTGGFCLKMLRMRVFSLALLVIKDIHESVSSGQKVDV